MALSVSNDTISLISNIEEQNENNVSLSSQQNFSKGSPSSTPAHSASCSTSPSHIIIQSASPKRTSLQNSTDGRPDGMSSQDNKPQEFTSSTPKYSCMKSGSSTQQNTMQNTDSEQQQQRTVSTDCFMSKLKLPNNEDDNDCCSSPPDASSSLGVNYERDMDSYNMSTPSQMNGGQPSQASPKSIWEMNYHEAAIFLQEGADNDKFDSHPSKRSALPAYLLTHSPWFYGLDLLASVVLLSLAIAERPAILALKGITEGIHATVELFTLSVLGISIVMQLKWLGWKKFINHKRSMMKITAWIIMVAEAITVIIRNTSHFRVTRALRPIFLVDNRYLGGARRFLRQLLQSVPPVLEVVAVLMLVLTVFTTLGYYLFSTNEKDPYFTTFGQSFVSLFVLLTTANYPDVMMPAYANSKWNAAFFILYLGITLYCIMNFMLAIVFVVFSAIEKDKFRKLLLHKRKACQLAFRLLVSRSSPHAITYDNFTGLLKYFKPKAKVRDVYLIFKALNKSNTGALNLNEFYQVYTACGLKWIPTEPEAPWFTHLPGPGPKIGASLRKLVTSPIWEGFVYVIICCNAVTLLVHTIMLSVSGGVSIHPHVTWDQLAYIAFYSSEVLLKLLGLGLTEYFRSGWNIFDFIVTILSIAGVLAESFGYPFFYIVILRPLRLLRLFRMRRRYREVFETLALLIPRALSACIVIIVIYYFFAIIGMEVFSKFNMMNCCVNSTVEQFYKADNTSVYQNYYYLNNFDNIFMAGVTLFELTVVNNWFIIMEGYAYVSGDWARLYFMLFYLVMMVVMSVVLAFILEAFTFRMQYNQTVNKDRRKPRCEVTKIVVSLNEQEVDFVYAGVKDTRTLMQYSHDKSRAKDSGGMVQYLGVGERSKTALQLRMYRHLLHSWIRDAGMLHHNTANNAAPLQQQGASSSIPQEYDDNRRNRLLQEAEKEDEEVTENGLRPRSGTRVTLGGVTEVVEQQEDGRTWTVRRRGNSIATNLMEWWKAETEDLDDEGGVPEVVEDHHNAQSQVIWGLDEEEVNNSNPFMTSGSIIENPVHNFCEPSDGSTHFSTNMPSSSSMPSVNQQDSAPRPDIFPSSFSSDQVTSPINFER